MNSWQYKASNLMKASAIGFVITAGILAAISSMATNGSLISEICAIASFGYLMLGLMTGFISWNN